MNSTLPINDALHGLLALTQLLGSLKSPDGSGATPTIVLTAAGIEVRMGDAPAVTRQPDSAAGIAQQEWLHKIETGLESLRQATATLNAAFSENAKKVDATLVSHAVAIDSVRSALSQNEQLMESMVELMGPADFTLPNPEEFAKIS